MIKVGSIVTPKRGSFFYNRGHRWTGKVIGIDRWEESGPLTVENHGSIDIELLTVESYCLDVGDIENYAYLDWDKHLEIVVDKE